MTTAGYTLPAKSDFFGPFDDVAQRDEFITRVRKDAESLRPSTVELEMRAVDFVPGREKIAAPDEFKGFFPSSYGADD